jgi:hypothetical protein
MAGVRFTINSGEISTGSPGPTTLLQLVAAANQRVLVDEISVSFKGVAPTDAPIVVRVLRQTTAGTMSAVTPAKVNSGDDETLQSTAQKNASAEPTASDVIFEWLVHPQSGYTWRAPFSRELIVKGGSKLGIDVQAGTAVNAVASMVCEE